MKKYEKYKSTELEFFGEIPAHWKISRMKNAAQIVLGKMLTPEDKGGYQLKPYLKSKNIGWGQLNLGSVDEMWFSKNELETYRVKRNDLLVSEGGEVGKTCIWDNELSECFIQNSVHKVTVFSENEPRFFLYYLNYLGGAGYFKQAVNQVSIAHLTKDKFMQTPCITPPLPEQRAIVAYLDRKTAQIDTLLAQKEALLQRLHQQRQALINEAVTKGLDPAAPRKPSGVAWLGEVPAHWEVKKLKQLTTKIVDGTHFTPNYIDEGVPFLRVTDIQTDEIDLGSTKFISQAEHEELSKRCNPEKGDILLSKNGTIGITKVIHWDWEFSVFVSLCLIKPTQRLNPYYFSYFFQSDIVNQQIAEGSRTTSVTNLHLEKIRELLISLPPIEEQARIVERLDLKGGEINEATSAIHTQIKVLKTYRQSLISEVVTGKVDVRPAAVEALAAGTQTQLWS